MEVSVCRVGIKGIRNLSCCLIDIEFNGSLILNWKGVCINLVGESCVGRVFDSFLFF